ncbi:MAG TPA: RNA polymerase sigma factor [Caulobacteraceae bacterium]|jgi:RNA polymerase sigma-70 factor (ECF subfamily)|nr:RNA polymerase sigma factor [Caulobacteraceae bacterium]
MTAPLTTEAARTMRTLWFDYLDAIEAARPRLHAFCLKLTGTVWEAEDLVQDTLLRGFGSLGRCDMSPPPLDDGSGGRWFEKPQAYLAQIATNLWIDRMRRSQRDARLAQAEPAAGEPVPVITRSAGAALFGRAGPQERAAVVLKDVFDFSLEEIATMLSTTPGAIKSALHRGRRKLSETRDAPPSRNSPASVGLIDKFIAAFNARDVAAITVLLLDSVTYEPQGVGGERGRRTIWLNVPVPDVVSAERHVLEGENVIAFTFVYNGKKRLGGLERLEEVDGKVSRIINYYFCPDTLAFAAGKLDLEPWSNGYHQDEQTLSRMIAHAGLPWA